ncbi:MAG: hypothetical protein KOO63_12725 [Bacteroidales bacterium]|nr:hypothetical protein [Candidatus Latescibacterota bacterium]
MTGFNGIYNLALADFLERIRRFSFLVVLGVTIVAGYTLVPAASASYNGFVIYGYRAAYNSAWIGTIIGMSITSMLSLLGFYLVKDSVSRDYETRVGQIIAATPVSKVEYMTGKWLSNLAVLSSIVLVLNLIAIIMNLVRGETSSLNIWQISAPIWLMSLPVMSWVSAIAVTFETVPLLRGTLGYIAYIALWGFLLMAATVGPLFDSPIDVVPSNDFMGASASISGMVDSMTEQGLDISSGDTDIYQPTGGHTKERFKWPGISWNLARIGERFLWLAGSLLLVMVTAIPFDRFDPARRRIRPGRRKKKKRGKQANAQNRIQETGIVEQPVLNSSITYHDLPHIDQQRGSRKLFTLSLLELRLMLRGKSWWWYLGALGLIISSGVVPKEPVRILLLAIAWAWPTIVWSNMGCRERHYGTESLVFPSTGSISTHLPAIWIAGMLVAMIISSGFGLRLIISGNIPQVWALVTGGMFVSAMALSLGIWTNGSRAFQILYPVLCYLGLSGRITLFDFKGVNPEAVASGTPLFFLVLAGILFVLAVPGRMKQMRRG